MKLLGICVLICLVVGCAADRQSSKYLRWVGDIEADAQIDGDTFAICHSESRVKQYFNFSQGLQYEGEKAAIKAIFKAQYIAVQVPQSGWVRVRFMVNCQGETGRFRLTASNRQYQELAFDPRITEQLMAITKSLDGWKILPNQEKAQDYYQYLIFKIENGSLIEIMP